MSVKARKFVKGIRLKSTSEVPTLDGEISNKDNKLQAHLEGDVRVVVTEDQTQTLTNKTIDATAATGTNSLAADSVDIVYDDAANPLYTLGNNLQVAMDAVKTQLDAQNEASEIDYDNTTSGLAATKVQGAIDEVDQNLDDHLADTTDAHDASAISYDNTTSGLTATEVQAAIDEVEGRLETSEGSLSTAEGKIDDLVTLSGVAANSEDLGTFTGTTIPDNSTVKSALQSLETQTETNANDLGTHVAATVAHGATGAVVGTTNVQTLQFKTYQAANFSQMVSEGITNNSQTGSDVVITEPAQPIVRLTDSGLTSVAGIAQASYALSKVVTLINTTSNDIDVKNNLGATVEERILTGTDDDLWLFWLFLFLYILIFWSIFLFHK